MYPPRSDKKQNNHRKRKSRKLWIMTNTVLVLMIALVVILLSLNDQVFNSGSSHPAEGQPEAASGGQKSSTTAQEEQPSAASEDDGKPTQKTVNPKRDESTADSSSYDTKSESASSAKKQSQKTTNPDHSAEDKRTSAQTDGKEQNVRQTEQQKPAGQNSPAAPANNPASPASAALTLNFGGDVQFAGKVESLLEQKGYQYPYQYLGNTFTSKSLNIVNLETPVTTGGAGAKNKQYVFKSSPQALEAMAKAHVDAVNLANNHILDQGVSGLLDTLQHLDRNGIAHAGAGRSSQEAFAPAYLEKQGIKVALLGFTRVIPESSWNAGVSTPGVAAAYDAAAANAAIKEARKHAALVVVVAHWGKERVLTPDQNQTRLAHGFIDAGADLVIGGHPHVLQGMEKYKGKWIAYSTGNFIFTKSSNAATWNTAVFQASCRADGQCGMKLIPFRTELGQPVPVQGQEAQAILNQIQNLSIGNVRIGQDGQVTSGS
ncbi:CapA family protein [Paenibacillus sp. JX-17]|uniref:CapA family protein n=1 Tax=Paenibacillus lacisoli TaxID=3064525 RepID=A0ABT9C9V6_9BACL|nr:CapA family protein [Paenibacillus sp. JX-17]MDO7906033.1 CapA family protein [Paenibacillus sp. JX-17]